MLDSEWYFRGQWLAGCGRLALVFVCGGAQEERRGLVSIFREVSSGINILWGLDSFLMFPYFLRS